MSKQCRFGDGEALCRVALPGGCTAFPDDREQDLCLHHLMRSRPLDGMTLLVDYTLPGGKRAADLFAGGS